MRAAGSSRGRWGVGVALGLLCWGLASPAAAGDLARALQLIRGTMGEEAIEGYEDFVDSDPNEALSILLDPEVHRRGSFSSLGKVRLSYADIRAHVEAASRATGLPTALIDAVIRTESGYRPNAVSRVGAQGLMQLMPATARRVGVVNAFDPAENIMGGARYLRRMYDRFGSLTKAIAAYNAGPGAVKKHGGVPPYRETRRYVATVLRRYQQSPLRGR